MTDPIIDRLEAQAKAFGCVKIVCSAANYERVLPAKWFHPLAKAGVDARVTDEYPDCHGIGLVDLKECMVWWIDLWGDAS